MAKKKTGSIAVPFLVTVFLGLLIVGGGAYGIYRYFGFGQDKKPSEPIPRQVTTSTYEDNHTILFILDDPDQKCSSTFVLMRSIPKDKRLIFVGIPTNTIAIVEDQQQSMKGSYEKGGGATAKSFVETVFGITVDRFMKMDKTAFLKTCDILGGVTYPVNVEIAGLRSDGSEQYLNGEQIETLVTYSLMEDGEVQRAYTASSIIANMINQSDGKRLADQFDNSFNAIINLCGINGTDLTAKDYREHKAAIKDMLERGTSIATFIVMDGTVADADYIPSSAFINNFVDQYFKEEQS